MILPIQHRSAFAKFRCGVAPLRLETGKYEGLEIERRVCPFCKDTVENEIHVHVITQCPLYDDIRNNLYAKAAAADIAFNTKSDCENLYSCFHVRQSYELLLNSAILF